MIKLVIYKRSYPKSSWFDGSVQYFFEFQICDKYGYAKDMIPVYSFERFFMSSSFTKEDLEKFENKLISQLRDGQSAWLLNLKNEDRDVSKLCEFLVLKSKDFTEDVKVIVEDIHIEKEDV